MTCGLESWHANEYAKPARRAQSASTRKLQQDVPASPKTPPGLARLYARPGFLLRRAHQISAAVFEDACRALALTPAQFGVLTVLQAHPGMGQSSLARALGFDKVTVLRVLRGMEARALVARAPVQGAYCFGDAVTMADICLAPQMVNARRFKADLSGVPRLVEIDARLRALPAFAQTTSEVAA